MSLPWQTGLVVVELNLPHSVACLLKPPVKRKDLGDVSYTSSVIANFVSYLVT